MTHVSGQTQLIALNHQRLLKVSGPDAEKFLQGQTTSDMRHLNEQRVVTGAHCDHKGRMHSSFVAARLASDSVALRVHESIAESARAALQKYAVFSKVELSVADDFCALAILGPDASQAVSAIEMSVPAHDGHFTHDDHCVLLRHNQEYFEVWAPTSHADQLQRALEPHCALAAAEQWDLAQIFLGLGQVRSETVGEFIPQMLNFQAVGGISFNKGCYTGQEVVARMHYLGKLKKHTYRAEASATEVPAPGAPVFSPTSESAVGTVVMAASAKAGLVSLLFVCPEQVVDGPLHLGAPDGARLQIAPLPYTLD